MRQSFASPQSQAICNGRRKWQFPNEWLCLRIFFPEHTENGTENIQETFEAGCILILYVITRIGFAVSIAIAITIAVTITVAVAIPISTETIVEQRDASGLDAIENDPHVLEFLFPV